MEETKDNITDKQKKYFVAFADNLKEGISYYNSVFETTTKLLSTTKNQILFDLKEDNKTLNLIHFEINNL